MMLLVVASADLRNLSLQFVLSITFLGGALNPNAAYLIIRGMKTLHLRVQQQNTTALRMAKLLEGHPKVTQVYYLGLVSHPEHYVAKQQITGFGGVVSFEIDEDLMKTAKFIDALKIPYIAPSFGGLKNEESKAASHFPPQGLSEPHSSYYNKQDNRG
ncbi:hypothetical protein LOK49_LG14G00553 [Camellia lanceoleosa]|uniref:Uncharacterized protein n=1 Tax=Camellia lanceoleosa TaxID=1840588 RepID=A0ACC0FBR8_9ERIC|nr:hypothetical protein LOK49_LG14G00553 [Camellia lanceoleosa]